MTTDNAHSTQAPEVHGEPMLRLFATARDTNARGDIFGGWLLANIDLAASIIAARRAKGPVTTVALNNVTFLKPIYPSDLVSFYCEVEKTGRTSMHIGVEVFTERLIDGTTARIQVAQAEIVFVAVSEPGKTRVLP